MSVTINGTTGIDKVQDASVTVAKLSATGTPSSSTYLRGDGSWQSPAGGVTSLNGQTGAITNTDYGAIGSYVVAFDNALAVASSNTDYPPNVTRAASYLSRWTLAAATGDIRNAAATGEITALSISGTWRRMTGFRGQSYGDSTMRGAFLFVRIS